MLQAESLTLHYGSSQILHGISMNADLGAVTSVMGSNGVGKTSLLKVFAGTHPSSSGSYVLDGENVTRCRPYDLAARGVGYVPQGRLIFPMLTVRENLETGFACLQRDERFVPDVMRGLCQMRYIRCSPFLNPCCIAVVVIYREDNNNNWQLPERSSQSQSCCY